MQQSNDLAAVVSALSSQIAALLPQVRGAIGEERHAALAARNDRIRLAATPGADGRTLLKDKAWLDETLAELLGFTRAGARPAGSC